MHRLYERHVTWEEAAELLFSGKYDNLTAREFKGKFPLKPSNEPVGSFGLRYRVSRLVEREIVQYLECESEWRPYMNITHLEDKIEMRWQFPDQSGLPTIEIDLREIPNARQEPGGNS